MAISDLRAYIALLLVLAYPACSGMRESFAQGARAAADSLCGDFREKEHCIEAYARSIERKEIDQYARLFRDDCEFITVMARPDLDISFDVSPRPLMRRRGLAEELEMMGIMFAMAREISFAFEAGTWTRVDSLGGEPCPDCWETGRTYEYAIAPIPGSGAEEPPTVSGRGRMFFCIGPASDAWKIFRVIEENENANDR